MSKNAARLRRNKIAVEEAKPSPREKFLKGVAEIETMQQQAIPKFEAKNQNQKIALAMLREGRSVVFLAGSAGAGKSMIAAYHAASMLKQKKVEKVYLVRPAVAVGKSIGLLPGDISEKMTPYFAQTLCHLAKFMGQGFLHYCLEKEIVEMKPAEYLRGMSMQDCVVILEEGQNFTKEEFEMMLTRIGENATLLVTGDQKQHDLKGESGLEQTIKLLQRMEDLEPEYLSDEDLDEMSSSIGVVRFTPDDVVRSGLTRALVKMYHHN